MTRRTVTVTAAAVQPVSVAEALDYLRAPEDDTPVLDRLIRVAVGHVETLTGRALITRTVDVHFSGWADALEILPSPLQSVAGVYYTGEDGTESEAPASTYRVDTHHLPGAVRLAPSASWPSDALGPGLPIRVRATVGHGDTAAAVPEPLRQAVLYMVAQYYEHREPVVLGIRPELVPMTVDALLTPYRIVGV